MKYSNQDKIKGTNNGKEKNSREKTDRKTF